MNIKSPNTRFLTNLQSELPRTSETTSPRLSPSSLETGPQGVSTASALDRDPASVRSNPESSRAVTQLQSRVASSFLGLAEPQTDESKEKEFDDIWQLWRDPKVKSTDLAGLKEQISPERYERSPQLQKLAQSLNLQNGEHETLGDLGAVSARIGAEKSEKMMKILNQYLAKGSGEQRTDLVRNILHDLAMPSDIAQRQKGTCAAAAIQMMLAVEHPERYAQMVTRLADDQSVKLPNGRTLHPNNVWRSDSKDLRNQSAKVLQNALMKHGNGTYDSTKDYGDPSPEAGLTRSQQKRLGRDILGYSNYKRWDSGFHSKEKLFQMVEDEIAHGRPAVISLPGHAVTVVGIDKTGDQHKVIINSWGQQFSMTVDELKSYVKSVRYRDDKGYDNQRTPNGRFTLLGDAG